VGGGVGFVQRDMYMMMLKVVDTEFMVVRFLGIYVSNRRER